MIDFSELLNCTDLQAYVNDHSDDMADFSTDSFSDILAQRDAFEEFVSLNADKITSLDYAFETNKAFLSLLLDLSLALSLSSCFQDTYSWASQYGITLGSRMEAAYAFMIEARSDNEIYIANFDRICQSLEDAIVHEDDDDKKAIATFISYYIEVLERNAYWIGQLRAQITAKRDTYHFLSSDYIDRVMRVDTTDQLSAYQSICDIRYELFNPIPALYIDVPDDLIEEGTEYARQISQLNEITVPKIRTVASRLVENPVPPEGRGVTPLRSYEELNAYLRSYGNMHYAKLKCALDAIPFENVVDGYSRIDIVDWGCGQAIATISLLRKLAQFNIQHCNINLIEPSEICLKRACLNVKESVRRIQENQHHFNDVKIKPICSGFDTLTADSFSIFDRSVLRIHLFSNVLDIENYSLTHIEELIDRRFTGENLFICTSPYINDTKAFRVNSFRRHFESNENYVLYTHLQNTNTDADGFWMCNNKFNGYSCTPHFQNGCRNQWTRIINDFSAVI